MIIRKLKLVGTLIRTIIINFIFLEKRVLDCSIHRMLGVVISDEFLMGLLLKSRGLVDMLFGELEVMLYL